MRIISSSRVDKRNFIKKEIVSGFWGKQFETNVFKCQMRSDQLSSFKTCARMSAWVFVCVNSNVRMGLPSDRENSEQFLVRSRGTLSRENLEILLYVFRKVQV